MLDINVIRERAEWVKEQTAKRNTTAPIDEILADDGRRREIILEVEELRRQRNESSKQIGAWMGSLRKLEADLQRAEGGTEGGPETAVLQTQLNAMQFNVDEAKAETGRIGDRIGELDEELRQVEARLRENMSWVPNIVQDSVPVGADESANVVHPPQGAPKPVFDFEPKAHWDLGPALDIIDFERGVKLSGSRFYILKGLGARLQRAVIQFMLNYHLEHHGYIEIQPPYMVRSAILKERGSCPSSMTTFTAMRKRILCGWARPRLP